MKFKGVLLDIDNTLYDYKRPHKVALEACFVVLHDFFSLTEGDLRLLYSVAKKQIHLQLPCTASSHNRLLYFQRMLELAGYNHLGVALDLYHQYWEVFKQNIVLRDGALEFLEAIKQLKVCLLTDLTADVQFGKIKQLKLFDYAEYLVTSEEAGVEKPHPYMFQLALSKMTLNSEEVCMIGDNYEKDICGAINFKIKAYWLNNDREVQNYPHEDVVEFQNFRSLSLLS